MNRMLTVGVLLSIGVLCGGCPDNTGPASLAGECGAFHDPGFAVQGKRLIDKQWIGQTQETGIQICKWKRPVK